MLATNYSVTFQECSTFLIPNGAYPNGYANKCVTAYELKTYFFVDQSYLVGYSSNQLVRYQDCVSVVILNGRIRAKSRTSAAAPFRFWYQIGDNSPVILKTTTISTTPTYSLIGDFAIPTGATVAMGVTNTSNVSCQFGTGNGGTTYTTYCGITTSPFRDTPTNDAFYYLNCNTSSSNLPQVC